MARRDSSEHMEQFEHGNLEGQKRDMGCMSTVFYKKAMIVISSAVIAAGVALISQNSDVLLALSASSSGLVVSERFRLYFSTVHNASPYQLNTKRGSF